MKVTPGRILMAIAVAVLVLFLSLRLFLHSLVTVRIHDDQIEVQKLSNAIAEFIIQEGYGYQVEMVESTIKEVHQRLLRGDVDITLEMWKENNLHWYNKGLQAGKLMDLGVLYTSGKQYWIVSGWYAEENNIRTVFDMRDHWQDFVDPGDPSKGIFFNCIYGWSCSDINKVKLKAYGLDRYFNTVSPLSSDSLRAIYEKAQERRLPVFGYYWEPNALMVKEGWHILEEPEYSQDVWLQVVAASNRPGEVEADKACAYTETGVLKIAHVGLSAKAPEVVQMFSKMRVDIDLYNEILFRANHQSPRPYRELGRSFLHNHSDIWSEWVTDEAQQKIEKALRTYRESGT